MPLQPLLKSSCVCPLEEENEIFILAPIDYFDNVDESFDICLISPFTLMLDIN